MADRPAIAFAPFLIPPDVDVLYRDGAVVRLQPHAVRVLRYLAEHHERVVSKNELLDTIWPDTFTTDGVLKKAVLQVRRALGDDADKARFVETHHARGYRFIAEVAYVPAPGDDAEAQPAAPATNLPFPVTKFVGRERAIEKICRALATTRLLTLTGPGGIGKTRLAVEVARRVFESGEDDVWLVELAALADPSLVPHAIASAAGAREEATRPILDTLCDFLKP